MPDSTQLSLNEDVTEPCKCCGFLPPKVYRRRMAGAAIRNLIRLASAYVRDPVPISMNKALGSVGRDETRLRHWGLIREIVVDAPDGNPRSGLYCVTPLAFDFIHRRTKLRSHIVTQGGNLIGYDGDQIGIEEAVGKNFDYRALMVDSGFWR